MPIAELPPPLPDDVLSRRTTLPRKPDAVSLSGRYIRLEPLDIVRDVDMLHAVSNGQPIALGARHVDVYDADARIWRFMNAGPFASAGHLADYLQKQQDAPDGRPFTVFDQATGRPVGVVNYLASVPEHLKIELGSIWYSPVAQRTGANTEACYLLLDHAFTLGYRRLEWKCNALNEASRQAALKLGFKFEGIQQAHYIVKNRNRDTAWFRMLAHEWPDVQARLKARLYADKTEV